MFSNQELGEMVRDWLDAAAKAEKAKDPLHRLTVMQLHRDRLRDCQDFEEFKVLQLRFIEDLLHDMRAAIVEESAQREWQHVLTALAAEGHKPDE